MSLDYSTANSYKNPQDLLNEALQDYTKKDHLFTEGSSDVNFWKSLVSTEKIVLADMGGKPNIEDIIGKNGPVLKKNDYIFFGVDRDYDPKIGKPAITEPYVYYQMCKNGYADGFNDLECFLTLSPAFNFVMMRFLNLRDKKKIEKVRNNIVEVAAFVGAFRLANRIKRQEQGNSTIDVLMGNRTIGRPYEFGGEINVEFFINHQLIKIVDGRLVVDRSRVKNVVSRKSRCTVYAPSVSEETADMAEKAFSDNKGNFIDLCRGHDLTTLIYLLIKNKGLESCPKGVTDLEKKFCDMPRSGDEWKILAEQLRTFKIGRFVRHLL